MTRPTSLQRFAEVLEAYGAEAQHWPADERSMLLELTSGSEQAAGMLAQARQLDQLLDQYTVEESDTALRRLILETIPAESRFDKMLTWLWPGSKSLIWQPALAVSVTLTFGILLGAFWSPLDPVDDWDTEGLYVMGLYNLEDQEP